MELKMTKGDAKAYASLYVVAHDLQAASGYARHIAKHKWRQPSFMRRGSVRLQAQAFTDALIMAYCRVWSPPVLKGFAWEADADQNLHDRIMRQRNQVVGHSAPPSYSVRPWISSEFSTHLFGAPYPHFKPVEISQLSDMIEQLNREAVDRRRSILLRYIDEPAVTEVEKT